MILNLRSMFDSNCIQIRIFYLTREYLKQLLKIVFFFSISFRCCSVNLLIDLFSFKRNIKLNIVIRENFFNFCSIFSRYSLTICCLREGFSACSVNLQRFTSFLLVTFLFCLNTNKKIRESNICKTTYTEKSSFE
jgi:hypothetical protein